MKVIVSLLITLALISIPVFASGETEPEQIELTTYYPAPVGEYSDLSSEYALFGSVAIGNIDMDSDGDSDLDDIHALGEGDMVIQGTLDTRGGLVIERRTSDPASPADGQMWIRTDIAP